MYHESVCQTSQVSRFCRETHGFQFNLTVLLRDRQFSRYKKAQAEKMQFLV